MCLPRPESILHKLRPLVMYCGCIPFGCDGMQFVSGMRDKTDQTAAWRKEAVTTFNLFFTPCRCKQTLQPVPSPFRVRHYTPSGICVYQSALFGTLLVHLVHYFKLAQIVFQEQMEWKQNHPNQVHGVTLLLLTESVTRALKQPRPAEGPTGIKAYETCKCWLFLPWLRQLIYNVIRTPLLCFMLACVYHALALSSEQLHM